MKKTHPFNTDSSLLGTVFFVPGESPYMFFKFNPLNTDTFNDPLVSVLTWFDCTTWTAYILFVLFRMRT